MDFYQHAYEHPWKERVLKITFSSKNAERSEGSLGCEVSYLLLCSLWGPLVGTYSAGQRGRRGAL